MADVDRRTGETIDNEQSALQAVEIIFSTRVGELIMLRHFGAGVVELLGRAMTSDLFALFRVLVVTAIDQWEPRLNVRGVYLELDSNDAQRGKTNIRIEVDFMPNGHKGDTTVQKQMQFGLSVFDDGLRVVQ